MGEDSWKNRAMIVGGVLGTLVGIGAAMLYIRAEENELEKARDKPPTRKRIAPSAALPIAIAVLGVLKQITGLADRE
ncbi:MAG: hypothetical protein ACRDGG_00945 [Anaerolineae bacterium]